MRFSRVLVVVTVAILAVFMAMESLSVGGSLTMGEALVISKNTPAVQEALNEGKNQAAITVDYWSADYIRNLKENRTFDDLTGNLPDNHGVWRVGWVIMPPGYHILHFVDELTGRILYQYELFAG